MEGMRMGALLLAAAPGGGDVEGRGTTRASPVCCIKGRGPAHKWSISFGFLLRTPLKSLWRNKNDGGRNNGIGLDDAVLAESPPADDTERNWVMKILRVRKEARRLEIGGDVALDYGRDHLKGEEGEDEGDPLCCERCGGGDDGHFTEFDKDSFSKLLQKVPFHQAKLYARLSVLGNLAYSIPHMKETNRVKRYGFHFVTSSFDLRVTAKEEEGEDEEEGVNQTSASAAYSAVASAASYLHSRANGILPFRSPKEDSQREIASFVATTDSVTVVVAAKEEVKQAVADDLNSTLSCPCEWFICDDDEATRYIVIQGSETLEAWKANLLFEPVNFEDMDVPVHRGIYEAAKGIYEQMLPEVRSHLKSHGNDARFRFTGHSLGGSLSLLLNLMLLIRSEVPASSLLPVITFGAPCIFCGGDELLRKLGLPKSHVQAVTMHRDIVPRAFSCKYPNHVAGILKAVNGRFRKHPCLNHNKLLYSPMGEFLILQPDEIVSPHHHLLPEGSGLYILSSSPDSERMLSAARSVFLNSPHPLQILSDRSAYGTGGTIHRDHDMNSYVKCVRHVLRQERCRVGQLEDRWRHWWSLSGSSADVEGDMSAVQESQSDQRSSSVLRVGKESLHRLGRLANSQNVNTLVILLLPARFIFVGGIPVHIL